MADPTKKNPKIEELIGNIFGVNRKGAIQEGKCVPPLIGCGGPAMEFRDEKSRREYHISGLCQKCQDEIFGR